MILAIDNEFTQDPPDTLIPFVGAFPNCFDTPGIFGFVRNRLDNKLPFEDSLDDSLTLGNHKIVTNFSVESRTDTITTIRFVETFALESANVNSNGVFVVSKETGMLTELATKTASEENVLLNGVNYLVSRRTAKIEVFTKL